MMFLNFPNNRLLLQLTKRFLKEAVDFAKDNKIMLCYDNAYSESPMTVTMHQHLGD